MENNHGYVTANLPRNWQICIDKVGTRYKRACRFIGVVCLSASLTACVTDDPRHGGLAGGLYGITSGAYERRIDDRTRVLAATRQQESMALEESRSLDERASIRREELVALQADLAALDRRTAALRAEIAALRSSEVDVTGRLAAVDRELARLRLDMGDLRERAGDEDAGDLRSRIEATESEIERLTRERALLESMG